VKPIRPALEKPIHWIGSSRHDLAAFPREVRRIAGYALRLAQIGEMPDDVKPMHGRFSGVMEIVARDATNRTFRVMYVVRLRGIMYVLHAFNKKAKHGQKTPQRDLDLLEQRLRMAKHDYEERYGKNETGP
jgi:phage-related protein